ncbi:MAG TPA: triose-phosphate isomerase, partial [Syntrophorhabdaceae bacterium]|nr:triose-phosphate isomerase [Syntrophorhabdaceae bacterium]
MVKWMVAGNWKMNNAAAEGQALVKEIIAGLPDISGKGEVVVAPSFTVLKSVYDVIKDSPVALASQNIFFEDKGAYTGEISPAMLKDAGCTYAIIGHSERRKYFHETDENVNLKVKKCLVAGLKPIICVGETDEERESGITEFVVGIQVKKALAGIKDLTNITIAYEPVWAIGTGKNATSVEAEEVHEFIRSILSEAYGSPALDVRILYGGSVTADNFGELIAMKNINGALVGGASLKSGSFLG